jgi:multicomponent Na+:H+ antiporter subunit C
MNALFALAVGICFGAGAYLLLKRDLLRVVAGVIVISNAATLLVIGSGLARGRAPILPLRAGAVVSDPLAQAMALTAVVITFGAAALLLGLVWRVFQSHGTIDQGALRAAEEQEKEQLHQGEAPE